MQANVEKAPGGTFERVAMVRTIAGRRLPAAIVHAFSATGVELAVEEKYAVAPGALDPAALDLLEQDARRAAAVHHPNVAAVRDVRRAGDELAVVSEFVEGEVLEELRTLAASSSAFGLEVGVRIIVDVLSALSALHTLGEGGLAHGEITPRNIVVGFDGAARLLRPYRGRVVAHVAEPDWFGYAAPEVLQGRPPDVRADLFGVGVLLWETLTDRRLYPSATRESRTARIAAAPRPSPPDDATWAAPLVAVVERALVNDPQGRYASAAEMAAAVRLAVRSKLAMPPRVSAVVNKLAGERIVQRRVQLALPEPPTRPVGPSRPSVSNEAVRVLEAIRPSSRPPTPKPGPVAVPAVPKAPPVPRISPEARPGPRPPAPQIKLADPKPPVPKVAAAPIARAPAPVVPAPKIEAIEPEPISLDSSLLSAPASSDFGPEAPTIPKKMEAEAEADVAAPPTDMLEAMKAFEGQLVSETVAETAAAVAVPKAPPSPPADAVTSPAPYQGPPLDLGPRPLWVAPLGGIGPQRGKRILIGVGVLCLLLLLGVGVRLLVGGKGSPQPAASATAGSAHPTATEPAAHAMRPAPTARTPVAAPPTASEPEVDDSTTPAAETSASAAPENTHRRHPKPRPTYDPMGI